MGMPVGMPGPVELFILFILLIVIGIVVLLVLEQVAV